MRPARRNPVFPTVKSRRPKAFPYAPSAATLAALMAETIEGSATHKTRQIRAPGSSHPRTVSVGRKPEKKPVLSEKVILQRFGRPHPFQPIPSPRRRFPAGCIPHRPVPIPMWDKNSSNSSWSAAEEIWTPSHAPFRRETAPQACPLSVVSCSQKSAKPLLFIG